MHAIIPSILPRVLPFNTRDYSLTTDHGLDFGGELVREPQQQKQRSVFTCELVNLGRSTQLLVHKQRHWNVTHYSYTTPTKYTLPLFQQGMIRIQQHPSEAGRPSSRTPSPVSPAVFRSAGQDHVSRPQQLQHRHDHHHQLPTVASRPSPERIGAGARSWIPPVVDDGRVAAAAAAVSSVCGEAHGSGKWDEEAQARASGSVGKQILQRYLTHLYPKVCVCVCASV